MGFGLLHGSPQPEAAPLFALFDRWALRTMASAAWLRAHCASAGQLPVEPNAQGFEFRGSHSSKCATSGAVSLGVAPGRVSIHWTGNAGAFCGARFLR